MKKHISTQYLFFVCTLVIVLACASNEGWAAGSMQGGTYTGIYSGGDYGPVTIVIDAQGNVTCDFFSTPNLIHYQSAGSTSTSSGWFQVNCASAANAPYWRASSNPNSTPGYAIIGFWGGDNQTSGDFTAYYASANTDPACSLLTGSFVGLWYDPSFTGTGFNILPSNVGLIVTYYGVDANGKMLWLISDIGPKTIKIGSAITLNMSYSSSGTFQAPLRNPVHWGQLTLNFTSCSKAAATLTGNDGTVSESLTMLAGAIGMPGCQ